MTTAFVRYWPADSTVAIIECAHLAYFFYALYFVSGHIVTH